MKSTLLKAFYDILDRFRFTDLAEFDRRYHDDDDEA